MHHIHITFPMGSSYSSRLKVARITNVAPRKDFAVVPGPTGQPVFVDWTTHQLDMFDLKVDLIYLYILTTM